MRCRWLSCPLLIVLALAATPERAVAQGDRRIEVAGGYAFMRDYDGEVTFPRGWFASVAADVAGPLSVAGDAAGSYKSMGGLDVDLSMSIHTLMGGPRLVQRADRAAPYVQMLFGVARIATTFDVPGETLSSSQNYFVMAPGGGVDVRFTDRTAIRLGANLRLIRSETFTPTGSEPVIYKEFQVLAGIAFR